MADAQEPKRHLSEQQVRHQAEAFANFYCRTGGDRANSFMRWADSKGLQPGDRAAIRRHVQHRKPFANGGRGV